MNFLATIRDVAKKASVSITTVSRVLNGDTSISVPLETRQRVFRAASELHYQGRSRNRRASYGKLCVGLVVFLDESRESERPYMQAVRLGVEARLQELGIGLGAIIRGATQLASATTMDGLVVVGHGVSENLLGQVDASRIVVVDHLSEDPSFSCVTMDYSLAVRIAIDHLYSLGHRRIGFVGARNELEVRLATYRSVMREKGLYDQQYEFLRDWWPEDGYACMLDAIDRGNLPTAFFVASDPLAIGALSALRASGIEVPKQVSIVSFDDISTARFTEPPLTTVRGYPELEGKLAVDLLVQRFTGLPVPLKILIPPTLVERGTTAPVCASPRQ